MADGSLSACVLRSAAASITAHVACAGAVTAAMATNTVRAVAT